MVTTPVPRVVPAAKNTQTFFERPALTVSCTGRTLHEEITLGFVQVFTMMSSKLELFWTWNIVESVVPTVIVPALTPHGLIDSKPAVQRLNRRARPAAPSRR